MLPDDRGKLPDYRGKLPDDRGKPPDCGEKFSDKMFCTSGLEGQALRLPFLPPFVWAWFGSIRKGVAHTFGCAPPEDVEKCRPRGKSAE
jgi:hypothetical protein